MAIHEGVWVGRCFQPLTLDVGAPIDFTMIIKLLLYLQKSQVSQ